MKNQQDIIRPLSVSQINPVYDLKGCISEWQVTVVFKNQNIEPPHAKGAHVSTENVSNTTLAKYGFSESVMKQGLERAWRFREAMIKRIAVLSEER